MSKPPGQIMQALGELAYTLHQMKPLIPTYIHLLLSAIFPIYTAAHASLARPSSAAPPIKKDPKDIDDLQDEEISPTIETLSASDALLFPILAGATLSALYFILKWLQDPALLNYYLGLYLAVTGLYFAIRFVKDGLATIRSMILPGQYSHKGGLWKLDGGQRGFKRVGSIDKDSLRTSPLPGRYSIFFQRYNGVIWWFRESVYTRMQLKIVLWKIINAATIIDTLDILATTIAAPAVYYHTFIDRPWFLTNFLGFSFCYGSLQITSPNTSWTGTLILSALFFYDIYMVFFTPMMITVATQLDVPVKLLFPRQDTCVKPVGAAEDSLAMQKYLECKAKSRTMAMLGLGDIIIPGIMLAFALRFDLYLYYRKLGASLSGIGEEKDVTTSSKFPYMPATGMWGERFWTSTKLQSPELQAKRFPKTYFTASITGYVIGMIVTVIVMQIMNHGQPALLYLVPGVLIALWGTALVRGDLKALWNYNEGSKEEKDTTAKSGQESESNDNDQDKEKATISEKKDGSDFIEVELAKDDKSGGSLDTESKSNKEASKSMRKSDTDKKSTSSTDQHIILFSLTTIKPRQQTPSKSAPQTASDTAKDESIIEVQVEDQPKLDETPSTEEWPSSASGNDSDSNDMKIPPRDPKVHERLASKRSMRTRSVVEKEKEKASEKKNGGAEEPALKRRRKA